jgi:hypothetical protein
LNTILNKKNISHAERSGYSQKFVYLVARSKFESLHDRVSILMMGFAFPRRPLS